MFYSIQCRAAEFMLHYAQLIPDETQRQEHLRTAIEDFKDSIQAHKELQSLTSREEFYVFACAVYKLAIACQATSTQHSIQQAQHIGSISTLLYQHYCSFPGMILLDEEITKLITHCLSFLQLNSFCDEELSHTEGLVEDIGDQGPGAVVSSGTKGEVDVKVPNSSSWQMPKTRCPGFQVNIDTANKEFTFANHEAILKVRHEEHSVTDKLMETWEHLTIESDCSDVLSAVISSVPVYSRKSANDSDLTVDWDSNTRDSRSSVTMETVDRSVVTQDLEQETIPLPYGRFVPPQTDTIETQLQGNLKLDSSQRVQGNLT